MSTAKASSEAVSIDQQPKYFRSAPQRLRLGFVPLVDCAPVIIAKELGFFTKYGLHVELYRELGWASIRDKIIYGELDAAHAIATMPMAATLGLGSIPCECVTGLVLNLHGNAITISNQLWRAGVRDGTSLQQHIKQTRDQKVLTFGVVYPFSSHRHLLRKWMSDHGVDPDRDVRFVVVPPAQMVANLRARHLDGFCVGEPWNTVAVQAGVGQCICTSAELSPGHPEKTLMVRKEFAEKRESEHLALIAALFEACAFCDESEHVTEVVELCERSEYIAAPRASLRAALSGEFHLGEAGVRKVPKFCVFHRDQCNEPAHDKAAWALNVIRSSGMCPPLTPAQASAALRVFRPDIYDKALEAHLATL